jgi:hypothetical protein
VVTGVVDVAAVEQRVDDVDRLAEHPVPDVHRRPAPADDVLVEVLAGAEPEREPVAGQQLHGRGLLRDHRRVVAHDRARHVRHQVDPPRRLRHRAQHAPRVRRVALLVEPG